MSENAPNLAEGAVESRPRYIQHVELIHDRPTEEQLASGQDPDVIGAFLPMLDPVIFAAKTAEMVNQVALDLSEDPEAHCPTPSKETVEAYRKDLEEKVAKGLLPKEALLVDPEFQLKYQMNVHNVLTMLVQRAAGSVVVQYRINAGLPPDGRRIQPVGAMPRNLPPAGPGSAIMLPR